MSSPIINLNAYLNFMGDCEEALNFYARIFGGKVTIQNRYDNPAMKAPKEFQNKVLHATLEFGKTTIMASDLMPKDPDKTGSGSGDAALSLNVTGPEEGKKVFEQLAEGGQIGVRFEKQFWGAWHGNLMDKYGIRWMVNCA